MNGGRRVLRCVAAGMLVGLLVVGCAGGRDAGQSGSPEPLGGTAGGATSPAVQPSDPYAIPDEIDAAYVDRVLEALLATETEALRIALSAPPGDYPRDEIIARLGSIYGQDQLSDEFSSMRDEVTTNRQAYRQPPGAPHYLTEEILVGTPECVVIGFSADFTARAATPPSEQPRGWLVLARGEFSRLREQHNPTPWVIRNAFADNGENRPVSGQECP